jgi:translation initiation factor 2 beta subunit (eIF-2beta)/eIF-5
MKIQLIETQDGKIIIENIDDFCAHLNRDRSYLCKYLEWQLGVCVEKNGICSRKMSQEEFQTCLTNFIGLFVQCSWCPSADTKIVVKLGKIFTTADGQPIYVFLDCKKCSRSTPVYHEQLAVHAFQRATKLLEVMESVEI